MAPEQPARDDAATGSHAPTERTPQDAADPCPSPWWSPLGTMGRGVRWVVAYLVRAVVYGTIGATAMFVVAAVLVLNSRPDLSVWHTAHLDEEYEAGDDVSTFAAYLELEDRLFAQLEREVIDAIEPQDRTAFNRFSAGSLADPARWSSDLNRTYEMPVDEPAFGALLVHGLTDAPYSLRHVAERLHDEGGWVVGLRLPGHGTAPSGLVRTTYEDMAGAVRIAASHLRSQIGDRPLVLVGYSIGAALSVDLAIEGVRDPDVPRIDRIALVSPAIGVTRLAGLAVWQGRLGRLLGLEKLAWNSVLPEYDPFKYNSFPVNAGNQSFRVTRHLQRGIAQLAEEGRIAELPPILAFASAVDATVSNRDLVQALFDRLPDDGHELVAFDVNEFAEIEHLMRQNPREDIRRIVASPSRAFAFTVVTNVASKDPAVEARRHRPGSATPEIEPLGMQWPREVYSLAHVALPFPVEDPLYGIAPKSPSPGIELGALALRGERGVLAISASDMLRIRSNPFYPYLEARIVDFVRNGPVDPGGG